MVDSRAFKTFSEGKMEKRLISAVSSISTC